DGAVHREGVVPVAAHLGGGGAAPVAAGEAEAGNLRQAAEQAVLQGRRDVFGALELGHGVDDRLDAVEHAREQGDVVPVERFTLPADGRGQYGGRSEARRGGKEV